MAESTQQSCIAENTDHGLKNSYACKYALRILWRDLCIYEVWYPIPLSIFPHLPSEIVHRLPLQTFNSFSCDYQFRLRSRPYGNTRMAHFYICLKPQLMLFIYLNTHIQTHTYTHTHRPSSLESVCLIKQKLWGEKLTFVKEVY